MNNWQKYFTSKILDRGCDYYDSNAVRIYTYSKNHVESQVIGSKVYNVRINFNESNITSMYCDCPYPDYCKHLAATLYYIDDHPEILKKEDYLDLISGFSHAELVEFLAGELPQNPELVNKLKLFKSDIDEDYFILKLNNSFSDSFSILKCMDEEFVQLIDLKHYYLLFQLCRLLIDHINEELKYGEFDMLEDIIYKLDGIMTRLRDVPEAEEGISDFLEYAISTTDDYFILEELTDSMSRNGDMSRLFD